MNDLLTKTLYSFFARGFPRKETGASGIAAPEDKAAAEPAPDCPENDGALADGGASIELDHMIPQIHACTGELQQCCRNVEDKFLGIGERLQTIHTQAGDLTRKASSTVELLGNDSADNVLTRVTRTADEALEELKQKKDHIQASLEQVLRLGDELHKLQLLGDQLKNISRFLKMVGINISIESSRSDDGEEIFLALANEIRALAVTVTQVTHAFVTDMFNVHTRLVDMHREMESKLVHFQQLSETARNSIAHTTPILQAIIHRSTDSLAHVGEDAQAISQSVANIVMSLQIHDNVSQRVEHIAEALTQVGQDDASRLSDGAPALAGDDLPAALYATLELQMAQLEQVIRDVEDAYGTGERAFEKIDRTIADIAQNMMIVETDNDTGVSNEADSENSAKALKRSLEEVNGIISRGSTMVNELQLITHDAIEAVSRITQHMDQVREVNFDIHLKSLNAMFKSIRLGSRGKAIEALVQEMKDVANQSNHFVGEVDGLRDSIFNAAKALQDQFDQSGGEDGPMLEDIRTRLDSGIEAFSVAGISFKKNAEETVALGRHLSSLIEEAAAELTFIKTFAGDLGAQLDQLRMFHGQLSSMGIADRSHLMLKKAQIADSYTMQQERDIHDRMINQDSPGRESMEENNHETGGPELFDDNVELF